MHQRFSVMCGACEDGVESGTGIVRDARGESGPQCADKAPGEHAPMQRDLTVMSFKYADAKRKFMLHASMTISVHSSMTMRLRLNTTAPMRPLQNMMSVVSRYAAPMSSPSERYVRACCCCTAAETRLLAEGAMQSPRPRPLAAGRLGRATAWKARADAKDCSAGKLLLNAPKPRDLLALNKSVTEALCCDPCPRSSDLLPNSEGTWK